MKKLLLAILCVVMLSSVSFAQDVEVPTEYNKLVYLGGAYNDGPYVTVGISSQVYKNLWVFSNGEAGQGYTLDVGAAFIFKPVDYPLISKLFKFPVLNKINVGVFVGEVTEWVNTPGNDNISTLAYTAFRSGGMIGYEYNEKYGVNAFLRRVVALDSENLLESRNTYGLFTYLKFN